MCKWACFCVEGEENRRGRKQRKAGGRLGIKLAVLGPGELGRHMWGSILVTNVIELFPVLLAMQKKQCETS